MSRVRCVRLPIIRASSNFVRFVMGKPYTGEKQAVPVREKTEEDKIPPTVATVEKFSKSFQDYLDTIAADLKKTGDEESERRGKGSGK